MKNFAVYIFFVLSWTLPAVAQTDPLLDGFQPPADDITCDSIPVLERGKFGKCAFHYLQFQLQEHVEELAVLRENRRAIQEARLWEWFTAPPIAQDCETLPELERAKFVFQCNVDQSGVGALAYFDENLTRLLTTRESLARRIANLQREYADLEGRQIQFETSTTNTAMPELETVLERFDAVSEEADVMERVAFELSRRPELTPIEGIQLVAGQTGVVLYGLETPDEPVDTLATNDILLAVVETSFVPDDRLLLVHPQYGIVTAIKSEFYTD